MLINSNREILTEETIINVPITCMTYFFLFFIFKINDKSLCKYLTDASYLNIM